MVCQPLYCPRLGTLRWKGRLYVCSTVDRAEQFGADPEMFLLGVATLLHRCNIAMIYFSFGWMKTFLRFSCSGCPHLRLSWTPKQKRSSRRSVRWNMNIYLLIALPLVLNQNCEFAVQSELRTNIYIFHKVGSQTETHPVAALVDPRFAKTNSDCQSWLFEVFSSHHVKPV